MNLELTDAEAKSIFHCLRRTTAKGAPLTISMEVERRLEALINKPVETTNEQPIRKIVSDLYSEFLRDRNPSHHDIGLLASFSVFIGDQLERLKV